MTMADLRPATGEMLIDVTRLLIRFIQGRLPTGVDRVCLSYIRRYGAFSRVVVFKAGLGCVFAKAASQRIFELLMEPGEVFYRAAIRVMATSPPMPLPGWRSAGRFLFNVGHSGLDHPEYARWLVRKMVRPIFFVHDLTPITHPEFCRAGESARHIARMRTILTTGAGIVANSIVTLDELSRFADASGWAMPPSIAAPLGCRLPNGDRASEVGGRVLGVGSRRPDIGYRKLEIGRRSPTSYSRSPIEGPYFVMLGTIEPRKNHWMALHVWRRLVERRGSAAPKLIIIGQRGWECENVLDLLERSTLLRGVVSELPGCSDTELVCRLRGARALIFPSMDEGYGLPLVEALSLGVPVIAGDLPVFHEVAGNIPDYLDPLDGPGWISCIEDYCLPDSPLRRAQLERLSGFVAPAWEDHFEAVDKLLGQIGVTLPFQAPTDRCGTMERL